jgi:hypothetical protein
MLRIGDQGVQRGKVICQLSRQKVRSLYRTDSREVKVCSRYGRGLAKTGPILGTFVLLCLQINVCHITFVSDALLSNVIMPIIVLMIIFLSSSL